MKFAVLLSSLLVLAACNAAHPFDRLDRSGTASAGGHTFRVNWNLEAAQATRTNPAWLPKMSEVAPAAAAATEQVTGCRVKPASIEGDVSLVKMDLDCVRG